MLSTPKSIHPQGVDNLFQHFGVYRFLYNIILSGNFQKIAKHIAFQINPVFEILLWELQIRNKGSRKFLPKPSWRPLFP